MTEWTERPLRPQDQPWPGLNTRGGRLDPGQGWLEDGSLNAVINEEDILEKRKGFVRGLDEAFDGVVCGLFKYTDDCGIEHLIVADEDSIKVRQPFEVPVFESSDAYPFDNFDGSGSLDADKWRNTSDYVRVAGSMVQSPGVAPFAGTRLPASAFTRWFKDAANFSYRVQITYGFDADIANEQRIGIIVRGNGDLSSGAFIQADLYLVGTDLAVDISHNNGTTISRLFTGVVSSPLAPHTGFLTLTYTRDLQAQTYIPSVQVVPTGGTILNGSAPSLSAIQDADLGLKSAIALGYKGGSQPDELRIEVVDGGSV